MTKMLKEENANWLLITWKQLGNLFKGKRGAEDLNVILWNTSYKNSISLMLQSSTTVMTLLFRLH